MGGIIIIAAAAGAAVAPLPESAVAVVRQPVVALGDLIDMSSVPAAWRGRAAVLTIARVPAGMSDIRISRTHLVSRVRSQMPSLGDWAKRKAPSVTTVRYAPVKGADAVEGACLLAIRDVPQGGVPRADDFTQSPCEAARPAPTFRYDRAGRSVRATRAVATGDIVPRFSGYGSTSAYAGDKLTLLSRVGPVTVAREVEAMQSARANQRTFVRTSSGEILSVQFAEGAR